MSLIEFDVKHITNTHKASLVTNSQFSNTQHLLVGKSDIIRTNLYELFLDLPPAPFCPRPTIFKCSGPTSAATFDSDLVYKIYFPSSFPD